MSNEVYQDAIDHVRAVIKQRRKQLVGLTCRAFLDQEHGEDVLTKSEYKYYIDLLQAEQDSRFEEVIKANPIIQLDLDDVRMGGVS